jgi:hypothetical protein
LNNEGKLKMEKLIQILLLVSMGFITGCGSSRAPGVPGTPAGIETRKEEQGYTTEEVEIGNTTRECYKNWLSYINKFKNVDGENEVAIKSVAVGLIASDCLKMEKISRLKIVLSAYEEKLSNNEINWSQLGRTILKTE